MDIRIYISNWFWGKIWGSSETNENTVRLYLLCTVRKPQNIWSTSFKLVTAYCTIGDKLWKESFGHSENRQTMVCKTTFMCGRIKNTDRITDSRTPLGTSQQREKEILLYMDGFHSIYSNKNVSCNWLSTDCQNLSWWTSLLFKTLPLLKQQMSYLLDVFYCICANEWCYCFKHAAHLISMRLLLV